VGLQNLAIGWRWRTSRACCRESGAEERGGWRRRGGASIEQPRPAALRLAAARGALPGGRCPGEAAQRIVLKRSEKLTDEQLLDRLRSLLALKGQLSGLLIDETEDMPSSSVDFDQRRRIRLGRPPAR
jgi:hypothetical protein